MISINKQPYPCSFSKNKIDFEVYSNMYFNSVLVAPSVTLQVLSFPTLGANYRIEYINPETKQKEEMRLVTVNAATHEGEIPYWSFAGVIEDYVDILIEIINNYRGFNAWYTASKVGTDSIRIEAKFALSDLQIIYYTNQPSVYINHTVDKAMINPSIKDGYQMKALVYIENDYLSGKFVLASAMDCFLNENAISKIDISSILNAEIESSWSEYPMPTIEKALYITPNLKRYYVDFVESWNNEPDQVSTKSDVMFVHWGGVSTDDEFMGAPVYLNTHDNNFLTWWPSGKKVRKDQQDWLTWMNQGEKATFRPHVKVYTNAGEYISLLHTQELKTWESFTFQTGFVQCDLESIVGIGEQILKWEFYILDAASKKVSPDFRYYPESNLCTGKVILYFNSFGVPETFNTSGDWTETTTISTSISNRSKSFNLNGLYPQSFVFNSAHQNSMKGSTGSLTKKECERLQSMINSLIAFLKDGVRWVPVLMQTSKSDIVIENQYIRNFDFELLKANENDRASFHEVIPDLIPVESCGVTHFNVVDNGISIATYGDVQLWKDVTLIETMAWNPSQQAYIPSTSIITPGKYRLKGTIEGYPVQKHFNYSRKRITAICEDTGAVAVKFKSSNPSETLYIDWGDGDGFVAANYTNVLTSISHTYTLTGRKKITIEKACFDDVVFIAALDTELSFLKLPELKNLENMSFVNSIGGNIYLSAFPKLQTINFELEPIFSVKLGFQRDLQSIAFESLQLNTSSLDDLLLELWEYRKFYTNIPTVLITGLSFTPSALVTSIMNGTGKYAGEGLVSNYGWSMSIS